MATCNNPKSINNTVSGFIDKLGFTTVFNPYDKTLYINTAELSDFQASNPLGIIFVVKDPNGNIVGDIVPPVSGTYFLDLNLGETDITIPLSSSGELFFGNYTIEYRYVLDLISYVDGSFNVSVCYDPRLEVDNHIQGCISVDTNCTTAKMVIKEQTNFKYNGLSPESKTFVGKLTYPDNYIEQKTFNYVPYSQDLDGSITGLYQVKVITTARYKIDSCHNYMDITYITNWAEQVSCSGALSTLLCCYTQSLEIAEKGGVVGKQMEEKLKDVEVLFGMAWLQEANGKNSEKIVKQIQDILGCDCKCQKGLQITKNPISFGEKTLAGLCAVDITTGGDGVIYITAKNTIVDVCDNTSGFSFTPSQDGCSKTWCLSVNFAILQNNILNAISSTAGAVAAWQEVLGINTCPCKTNVIVISQTGLPPTETNPLSFSQVTICGGNIVTFEPITVTSISMLVDDLNANSDLTNVYGTFSLSPDETGIISSYVPTNGSCTVVVWLYETCSSSVIVNGTPLIMDVNRLSTYYAVLNSKYFTKSDKIVDFQLHDNTTITGDTIANINISESTIPATYNTNAGGDDYTLAANSQCARDLVSKTGTFIIETTTNKGCKLTTQKTSSYPRVDYSERYMYPYRYNPQINDLPYYGDYIYINNVDAKGNGCIRAYNTVTKEVFQIAGNLNASLPIVTPTTPTYGDTVTYYYPSSIYVDRNEITNGHPAIYFVTFGGVFCKLIRERSTECDERANWRNYVLAGACDGGIASVPNLGNAARFNQPYGSKRMGTINGQPSFIIYNTGASRLDFVYYVSGTVTTSSNWNVKALGLDYIGSSVGGNINIDTETYTYEGNTYTNIQVIYVFGLGAIKKYYFKGSLTSLTDITDSAQYIGIDVISNTVGTVDGTCSVSGGVGTGVAQIRYPITLSKINYDGKSVYVFSEEYAGGAPPAGGMKLRGFDTSTANPTLASSYRIITLVADNGVDYSTFGNNVQANGVTLGMFWHPVKSRYYEFPLVGGIRKLSAINTTQAIVTGNSSGNYILYANESGADSAIATKQPYTQIVDTNYELLIS